MDNERLKTKKEKKRKELKPAKTLRHVFIKLFPVFSPQKILI